MSAAESRSVKLTVLAWISILLSLGASIYLGAMNVTFNLMLSVQTFEQAFEFQRLDGQVSPLVEIWFRHFHQIILFALIYAIWFSVVSIALLLRVKYSRGVYVATLAFVMGLCILRLAIELYYADMVSAAQLPGVANSALYPTVIASSIFEILETLLICGAGFWAIAILISDEVFEDLSQRQKRTELSARAAIALSSIVLAGIAVVLATVFRSSPSDTSTRELENVFLREQKERSSQHGIAAQKEFERIGEAINAGSSP